MEEVKCRWFSEVRPELHLPYVKLLFHRQGNHGTSSILDTAKFFILPSFYIQPHKKSHHRIHFQSEGFCHPRRQCPTSFKGSLTRDFQLQVFFSWISFPRVPSIPLGPFPIFSKICRDIHKWIFIIGVNDTSDKLFTSVINTTDYSLSPIFSNRRWCHWYRMIPAINL